MINSFFYILIFETMSKLLCSITDENTLFPLTAVFRDTLFEDFKIKFPKAIELILSFEEINNLNSCKYEDFCDFIKNKVNNLSQQEEFV